MTVTCPHGDPTCPCPDGDLCHYEGMVPMECPNPPPRHDPAPDSPLRTMRMDPDTDPHHPILGDHCHVEGCTWTIMGGTPETCGLIKLGTDMHEALFADMGSLADTVWWQCGAIRSVVSSGLLKDM